MKIETPQILWHNGSQNDNGKNAPLYSLSLLGGGGGGGKGKSGRCTRVLATAGNTPEINLWKVWLPTDVDDEGVDDDADANRGKGASTNRRILQTVQRSRVEHHLALTRHERSVNAISFSPDGRHLATAGDGGSIVVYSLPPSSSLLTVDDDAALAWSSVTKENDLTVKIIGSPCEDVMDLDWSPDSRRIVVGSLDHTVLVIEDQSKPPSPLTGGDERSVSASTTAAVPVPAVAENANWKVVHRNSKDHTHYVQGVSYDPLGVYVCSMGSDRTVRVYRRKDPEARGGGKRGGGKASAAPSGGGGVASTASEANSGERQPTRQDEESKERERKERRVRRSLTEGKFELGKSLKVLKFYDDEMPPPPPPALPSAGTTAGDRKDAPLPTPAVATEKRKRRHLFADESTVESFFRRLSWTADGAFLVTPAALWHSPSSSSDDAAAVASSSGGAAARRGEEDKENSPAEDNAQPAVSRPTAVESLPGGGGAGADAATTAPSFATYLFARHRFDRPYKVLSGLEKPSVVVRPNPVLFKLPPSDPKSTTAVDPLPYRSVFAVLTTDSVVVYDTHHSRPLSIARGLHYAGLTDGAWSNDGRNLLVCSTDGYVSMLSFEEGELGEVYVPPPSAAASKGGSSESSSGGKNGASTSATADDVGSLIPPCAPGQSAVIEGRPAKKAKRSDGDEKDDGEVAVVVVASSSSSTTTPPPPSRKAGKKRIAPTLISAGGPRPTSAGPAAMVVVAPAASTEGETAATTEGGDEGRVVDGVTKKRSAEGDSSEESESVAATTTTTATTAATAGGGGSSSGSEEQVVVGAVTKLSLEGKQQQQQQPVPAKKKKRIQPTLVSAVQ